MSKWLQPSAYFGSYFGAGGEAVPGILSATVRGAGSLSALAHRLVAVSVLAIGAGTLVGSMEAIQAGGTVDLSATLAGAGAMSGLLSATDANPIQVSGGGATYSYSRGKTTQPVDLALHVSGSGGLFGSLVAAASIAATTAGAGVLIGSLDYAVSDDDSDALSLILALAA